MVHAITATTASNRLLDLVGRWERQENSPRLSPASRQARRPLWMESGALSALRWWPRPWQPMPMPPWWQFARESTMLMPSSTTWGSSFGPRWRHVQVLPRRIASHRIDAFKNFPACESLASERGSQDEAAGDRLRLLKAAAIGRAAAAGGRPASRPCCSRCPTARRWRGRRRSLRVGEQISLRGIGRAGWCENRLSQHHRRWNCRASFRVRGGIVDIFAPDWYEPVRVEFFGDEIESIRRFEVSSQRSLAVARRGGRDGCASRGARPSGPSGRLSAAAKLVSAGGAGRVGSSRGGIIWSGWSGRRILAHGLPTCCSRCFAFPR